MGKVVKQKQHRGVHRSAGAFNPQEVAAAARAPDEVGFRLGYPQSFPLRGKGDPVSTHDNLASEGTECDLPAGLAEQKAAAIHASRAVFLDAFFVVPDLLHGALVRVRICQRRRRLPISLPSPGGSASASPKRSLRIAKVSLLPMPGSGQRAHSDCVVAPHRRDADWQSNQEGGKTQPRLPRRARRHLPLPRAGRCQCTEDSACEPPAAPIFATSEARVWPSQVLNFLSPYVPFLHIICTEAGKRIDEDDQEE